MHRHAGPQNPQKFVVHYRVDDTADPIAAFEHHHRDAEAGERLREFEAKRAAADHAERLGQRFAIEDRLVGIDQVTQRAERLGDDRLRSGRDHHRTRRYRPAVVQRQRRRAGEPRAALYRDALGQILEPLLGRRDEVIPLPPHALHHARAVDFRQGVDPEHRRAANRLRRHARRHQQLGRHAPDRRAGRPGEAVVDQQRPRALGSRDAFRRQPRRPRADHGDVARQLGCLAIGHS